MIEANNGNVSLYETEVMSGVILVKFSGSLFLACFPNPLASKRSEIGEPDLSHPSHGLMVSNPVALLKQLVEIYQYQY